MMAHIEVFTEARRQWHFGKRTQYRWRVVARNGRIVASGSEGYNNLGDLWNGVRVTMEALGASINGPVPIHDGPPARRDVRTPNERSAQGDG